MTPTKCSIALFVLLIACCSHCAGQEKAKAGKAFWAAQGIFWASMVADGVVSGKDPAPETNFLYRNSAGRFARGRYFAINLPLAAGVTAVSLRLRRVPRAGRYFALMPAVFGAQDHIRAALTWR